MYMKVHIYGFHPINKTRAFTHAAVLSYSQWKRFVFFFKKSWELPSAGKNIYKKFIVSIWMNSDPFPTRKIIKVGHVRRPNMAHFNFFRPDSDHCQKFSTWYFRSSIVRWAELFIQSPKGTEIDPGKQPRILELKVVVVSRWPFFYQSLPTFYCFRPLLETHTKKQILFWECQKCSSSIKQVDVGN